MRIRTAAVALFAFVIGMLAGAASIAVAQSSDAKPAAETEITLRIVGRHQHRVVGKLMARVDGQWVEVELAPQDMFVGAKR